jgi:hypothetical protein
MIKLLVHLVLLDSTGWTEVLILKGIHGATSRYGHLVKRYQARGSW